MNLADEIQKVFSDFEDNLTKKIQEFLEENQKMGKNTHEFAEKNAMPPKAVKNTVVDLDLNLNLNINIRPHIFPMAFEK